MLVLGIETSCDETAVALYDSVQGLVGHEVYSQISLHANYGGVVPELAARDHICKTLPLLKKLLESCEVDKKDLDGVAYTAGPGLIGALLVGASIGRSLAWGLGVPAVAVNHLEGHLVAPFLGELPHPRPPFLALLVSGGHSQFIWVKAIGEYEILGETLDDAVGEAFDKVAKLLGLGYPGGPEVAKIADQGDAKRFHFPRPLLDRPGLDLSFSGLKSHVIRIIDRLGHTPDAEEKAAIAAGFQEAVVDVLVGKSLRALELTNATELVIAGGVGANLALRQRLTELAESRPLALFFPKLQFCTDNAAMIALAGCLRLQKGESQLSAFDALPRWELLV